MTAFLMSRIPAIATGLSVNAARAVDQTARDIRDEAVMLSPVLDEPRSGREVGELRDSWSIRRRGAAGWKYEVYTNVWYAHFVEYGVVHAAAQPMLTPAADHAWPGFLRRMGTIVT